MVVVVVPAMEAGEVAKVGSCLVGCNGAFLAPCNGSCVVIQSCKSKLMEIIEGDSHVHLGEDTCLFEITVCEVAQKIVNGDDVLLKISGEGGKPECGRVSRSEEDTSHAWLSGVHRADHRWVVWHHFGKVCRSLGDVTGQGFEVIQVVT